MQLVNLVPILLAILDLAGRGALAQAPVLRLQASGCGKKMVGACVPTPTKKPTTKPRKKPTKKPSAIRAKPTVRPTRFPTLKPTAIPSASPTRLPTPSPTALPTNTPTAIPTGVPTYAPTAAPTNLPTSTPTKFPTNSPTRLPSKYPTRRPTARPVTNRPTLSPTRYPSYCAGAQVKEFGGHLYGLYSSFKTWGQADSFFKSKSCCGTTGHLVTITSQAEKAFVETIVRGNYAWTGLNDATNEGTYRWTTGEPYDTSLFVFGPASETRDYSYMYSIQNVLYGDFGSATQEFWSLFEFDCPN